MPPFLYIFLILHRYCFAYPLSKLWETITDAAYEFPIMHKYGEVKSKNGASLLRDSWWKSQLSLK